MPEEGKLLPGWSVGVWSKRTRGYKDLLNLALTDTYASFSSWDGTRKGLQLIKNQILIMEAMLTPYINPNPAIHKNPYEEKRKPLLDELNKLDLTVKENKQRAFLLLRKWFALILQNMYDRNLLVTQGMEAKV